jgi:uncharacterized protein (TIGR03083 family)
VATNDIDYEGLVWAESEELGATLDELDDPALDHPSLCDGWRVRDVYAHMLLGYTTPLPSMIVMLARYGFNVPKGSAKGSARYASEHSSEQLRSAWHDMVDHRVKKGISKVIPAKEGFVDHLIHHQDILRPLGRTRTIGHERLVAALDVMPSLGGFVKSKQRMAGLRWTATDVDWHTGTGPEVNGPAESLILLASGRPAPLGEVTGDGVATLRERLSA